MPTNDQLLAAYHQARKRHSAEVLRYIRVRPTPDALTGVRDRWSPEALARLDRLRREADEARHAWLESLEAG